MKRTNWLNLAYYTCFALCIIDLVLDITLHILTSEMKWQVSACFWLLAIIFLQLNKGVFFDE